jgi:hypothetical protein
MAAEESPLGVHFRNAPARAVFCLAAAVVAAAAIDPSIEWMANDGLFGAGTFTDHSNLDVIPALAAGLVFAALFVAGVVRRMLRRQGHELDWLRGFTKLLPVIFALQLLVLWSMETVEQIVVWGEPLGGTLWLGGPVVVSLCLHAAGCLTFTWLLARALQWSAKTVVAVMAVICEFFCTLVPEHATPRPRAGDIPPARFLEPFLARLNGRAPPHRPAKTIV